MFPDFSDLADTGKKLVDFMKSVEKKLDTILAMQEILRREIEKINQEIENV